MTAKEKAKELVDKFSFICSTCDYEDNAKQYALIAVDEIIETFIPKNNRNYLCEEIEYLEEVKQEIEKL